MDKKTIWLDRLSDFVKYLLIAGVVVFIGFLFPNQSVNSEDYKLGSKWKADDLVAPFSFAIRRNQKDLDADKLQIQQRSRHYYRYDTEANNRAHSAFATAIEQEKANQLADADFNKQIDRYLNFGKAILTDIYDTGIGKLAHENSDQLYVVKGNVIEPWADNERLSMEDVHTIVRNKLGSSDLKDTTLLSALLTQQLHPNILYDDTLSAKFLQRDLDKVAEFEGKVQEGDVIIKNGDPITNEARAKLLSYDEQFKTRDEGKSRRLSTFIGYLLLTTLIIVFFLLYVRFVDKEVFSKFSNVVFMLMWIVLFSYLVHLAETTDAFSVYMIPFCIVPIVIKNFFNSRIAFFIHVIIILIVSFLSSMGYEFTFIMITAGIAIILSNVNTRYWNKFFVSILYLLGTFLVASLGLTLIKGGAINELDFGQFGAFGINALLTLLAYPFVPLLERVFGYTSDVRLLELGDLNRPLLKEMSMKAPGTLQHSLQVSNLSEAAANAIGANSTLIKVAALYHDIGKMNEPFFFIENQRSGENPHDHTSNKESAQKIIEHVTEGVVMAKKAGLPKVLIDFILTHHGKTRVEYFYRQEVNSNPDTTVDEADFMYPGPDPRTKEETILMLADSIEAASKSLSEHTFENVQSLIDSIIKHKMSNGHLDESDLSLAELEKCRKVFVDMICNIHHVRIKYPDEQNPKEN